MNSTCNTSYEITQYASVGFAGLSLFASAILLILKKDGLFDRFWPKPVPRRQALRKLHDVENRLGNIILQLTNLTPQNSTESSNDGRLHSSTGIRGDRNSDSDEDVQRMRMCEEGTCIEIRQQAPAVLEESRGLGSGDDARAEPRRWNRQIELVCSVDTARDQAAHRSSSRSGSSPRHDQPRQRQTLRASTALERRSSSQSRSGTSAQKGVQTSH